LRKRKKGKKIELKKEFIGDIKFENVYFRYGSRVDVFNGLNLTIPKGKVTAFVGESGSGKTTLVNILLKMYPIQSGRITIGDLSLNHIDTQSLRNKVSVVPQKIDLFAGNVIENIAVGQFNPDMEKILRICKKLGILSFIEELPNGFETYLGENGAALSGGQKQRIAIARAIYKNPEILILDEATSSLDSASEKYVQDTVNYLREYGKTVILIAHRLSTVFMADKICVLEKGELVEEGTHDFLIQKEGCYFSLWKNQFPFLNGHFNNGSSVLKSKP
jgi:ABC-type multidrug transport system fused ATPase/permease subunit